MKLTTKEREILAAYLSYTDKRDVKGDQINDCWRAMCKIEQYLALASVEMRMLMRSCTSL